MYFCQRAGAVVKGDLRARTWKTREQMTKMPNMKICKARPRRMIFFPVFNVFAEAIMPPPGFLLVKEIRGRITGCSAASTDPIQTFESHVPKHCTRKETISPQTKIFVNLLGLIGERLWPFENMMTRPRII